MSTSKTNSAKRNRLKQAASHARPLDINQSVAFCIVKLVNMLSRRYQSAYEKQFDLTLVEWRILVALAFRSGVSAREVCALTGYGEMSVSRAVRRLEKTKRIIRQYDDKDRRRTVLRLSSAGRKIYDKIIPHYLETENDLLSALSAADQNRLHTILAKLLERMAELPPLTD